MDSFFGIGAPELVLILVIAGIVMGPERIAHIARWFGKTTAQLQMISRSFVAQLNQELDGVDDDGALRDALGEMQALRQELETLKGEFVSVTNAAAEEGQEALQEIKDAPKSIMPPSLRSSDVTSEQNGTAETAVSTNSANGSNGNGEKSTTPPPSFGSSQQFAHPLRNSRRP